MTSIEPYIANPADIENESFRQIRTLCDLSAFNRFEQQVVMRIVHSVGLPEIVNAIRISDNACAKGMAALVAKRPILCDVEMVKHGLTKRFLSSEPLCFLNHPDTQTRAKESGETRSMAALDLWRPHLADSIVVIGNAPTALFRLLEMLAQGVPKPALIVGIPVGFVGAAESKQALWQSYQDLGVECVTVLGRQGGSAIAASVCNALMRCNVGEFY